MTDARRAAVSALAAEISNAILESNRVGDDIIVDPDMTREAMVLVLAAMLEASPDIVTPRDMRLAAESVAAELKNGIKAMRASYEATGQRLWNAEIIRRQ